MPVIALLFYVYVCDYLRFIDRFKWQLKNCEFNQCSVLVLFLQWIALSTNRVLGGFRERCRWSQFLKGKALIIQSLSADDYFGLVDVD